MKKTVLLLLAMLAGQALGFFPTCECKAIDSHFDSDLEDSIVITEGSPVIINEQIASEKAIAMLRRGMEKTISEGILKKAKSELVDIACNGRSFAMNGNTNRMELCAFFPAQQPKYTVMVIMEKEGLPTSVSTYCGSLLKYVVTKIL